MPVEVVWAQVPIAKAGEPVAQWDLVDARGRLAASFVSFPGHWLGRERDSRMTNVRSLTIWATVALLLVAIEGCTSDSNEPARSVSPTPSSTSSTPTTMPPTDTQAAAAAASTAVRNYFEEIDALRQDPRRPLQALNAVATSVELSAEQRLLQSERRQRLRQVGDTEVIRLAVQSVNLDHSDPQAGEVPTAQVDVCWDVSDVDIVDETGESVVRPTRPDRGWIRFTVADYHGPTNPNDGWRIASSQDLKQAPCATS